MNKLRQINGVLYYNNNIITDISEILKYAVISGGIISHPVKFFDGKLIPSGSSLYYELELYEKSVIKDLIPEEGNLIILKNKPFEKFKFLGKFKFSDNKVKFLLLSGHKFIRKSSLEGFIINTDKNKFKISYLNSFLEKISKIKILSRIK